MTTASPTTHRRSPHYQEHRVWRCVNDPSGIFTGRCFSITDIRVTARRPCLWPEGITWQHIRQQELLIIENGCLKGA